MIINVRPNRQPHVSPIVKEFPPRAAATIFPALVTTKYRPVQMTDINKRNEKIIQTAVSNMASESVIFLVTCTKIVIPGKLDQKR